jgi:hypothetical protein
MLDRLVVVDYIEGAGGEYLSNVINHHKEFNSANGPLVQQPHNHVDVPQKWFNSQRHVIPNWDTEFESQSKLFLNECRVRNIDNLSVTYHLCIHPEHLELMRPLSNNTRFVKIDSTGHERTVKMDFIRKVLFNSIHKKQIREVKYRIGNSHGPLARDLIGVLMQGKLYGIDLVLYKRGLPITRENREITFNQLLNKKENCPSNDLTVLYENFFVSLDKLEKSYYTLCDSLNILPNTEILNAMLIRNQKNLEEVTEFEKNFDAIKNCVFSTTLN